MHTLRERFCLKSYCPCPNKQSFVSKLSSTNGVSQVRSHTCCFRSEWEAAEVSNPCFLVDQKNVSLHAVDLFYFPLPFLSYSVFLVTAIILLFKSNSMSESFLSSFSIHLMTCAAPVFSCLSPHLQVLQNVLNHSNKLVKSEPGSQEKLVQGGVKAETNGGGGGSTVGSDPEGSPMNPPESQSPLHFLADLAEQKSREEKKGNGLTSLFVPVLFFCSIW